MPSFDIHRWSPLFIARVLPVPMAIIVSIVIHCTVVNKSLNEMALFWYVWGRLNLWICSSWRLFASFKTMLTVTAYNENWTCSDFCVTSPAHLNSRGDPYFKMGAATVWLMVDFFFIKQFAYFRVWSLSTSVLCAVCVCTVGCVYGVIDRTNRPWDVYLLIIISYIPTFWRQILNVSHPMIWWLYLGSHCWM